MTEKEVPIIFQRNKVRQTDAEILSDKASRVLAELTKDYVIQVQRDIQAMYDVLKRAETANAQQRFDLIQTDFFVKMHDLKGQGATFGYPILTEIGAFACDFLRNKKGFSMLDISFLKQLTDDANVVIQKNLTGDGGATGAEIRKRLSGEQDG